jgi:hypothetical protein
MAFPDVLAAMIHWAKADPVLAAIHGGRVSSTLPEPEDREYPYLRVFDIPATGTDTEYASASVLLQWDAFAMKGFDDRSAPDWATAADLARALSDRIRMFDGYNPEFAGTTRRIEWAPGEVVIVQGVRRFSGPGRQPDPEGLGRHRVDTIVTAKAG